MWNWSMTNWGVAKGAWRMYPPTGQGTVRMAKEIRCPKCGERQDMPDDLAQAPWCLNELLESVTAPAK